jgi:hypothetical protein
LNLAGLLNWSGRLGMQIPLMPIGVEHACCASIRLGLGRPDVADAALKHAMSAGQACGRARRRGFWARRAFAEDLRTCLTELVLASELIAGYCTNSNHMRAKKPARRLM